MTTLAWEQARVCCYGHKRTLDLAVFRCLWYGALGAQPVRGGQSSHEHHSWATPPGMLDRIAGVRGHLRIDPPNPRSQPASALISSAFASASTRRLLPFP